MIFVIFLGYVLLILIGGLLLTGLFLILNNDEMSMTLFQLVICNAIIVGLILTILWANSHEEIYKLF